jgi:hypothetical protein
MFSQMLAGEELSQSEGSMKQIARIALATALLMAGATFAMAQNGPPSGGYPPAGKKPSLYGYYDYYAGPRYAPSFYGAPYYYPDYNYYYPGYTYGYMGPRGWR